MVEENPMNHFYLNHIKGLEDKIFKIYTVSLQTDDSNNKVEPINLLTEIPKLKQMESVYSVIENGMPSGETYEKYNKYLTNVRDKLQKLKKEQKIIEEKNIIEITNIRLLLKELKSILN